MAPLYRCLRMPGEVIDPRGEKAGERGVRPADLRAAASSILLPLTLSLPLRGGRRAEAARKLVKALCRFPAPGLNAGCAPEIIFQNGEHARRTFPGFLVK